MPNKLNNKSVNKSKAQAQKTKTSGFTLIELLVTIAIVSILMMVALPNFSSFFDKRRLVSAAEQISSHAQQARTEAISRSTNVTLNVVNGASWSYGFSDSIANCNPALTAIGALACTIEISDGVGVLDDDDKVLMSFLSSDFKGVSISSDNTSITFDPMRGLAEPAIISLKSGTQYKLNVVINAIGLVKLCSPAGTTFLDYKSC